MSPRPNRLTALLLFLISLQSVTLCLAASGQKDLSAFPSPTSPAFPDFFRSDSLGRQWPIPTSPEFGECEAFHGSGFKIGTEGYWAFRCRAAAGPGAVFRYGYMLGDAREPTLERVTWVLERSKETTSRALDSTWRAVRGNIERVLGSPQRFPDYPKPGAAAGAGSASWRDVQDFRTSNGVLRVYRVRAITDSFTNQVIVDHWSNRLRADVAAHPWVTDQGEPLFGLEEGVDRVTPKQAVSALGSRHPELRAALAKNPSSAVDLPRVIAAVGAAHGGEGSGEDQDLVLLSAHLWVQALADSDRMLADPFLAMYSDSNGCDEDPLVYMLARRASSDQWADAAFLELMDVGWDCAPPETDEPDIAGQDLSRSVIDHGESFLLEHPRASTRTEVAWRLAMACENAWTLYKSIESDPKVTKSPERTARARADRDRAIQLYEDLVRADPSAARSVAAAKRVNRMRLDIATDYRRYWRFED